MKYIITEAQNEELKRYLAIKNIVDSFNYKGLIKIEFDVTFDNMFGFYKIYPTFYMDYWKMTPAERQRIKTMNTILRNELCQKIEDYLGIHMTSPKGEIIVVNH